MLLGYWESKQLRKAQREGFLQAWSVEYKSFIKVNLFLVLWNHENQPHCK